MPQKEHACLAEWLHMRRAIPRAPAQPAEQRQLRRGQQKAELCIRFTQTVHQAPLQCLDGARTSYALSIETVQQAKYQCHLFASHK